MAVTAEFLPTMPKLTPLTSLVEAPVHTVETRLFDLSSNLRSQLMTQHGVGSSPVSVSIGSENIAMSAQEELDCQLQLLSGGKGTQASMSTNSAPIPGRFITPNRTGPLTMEDLLVRYQRDNSTNTEFHELALSDSGGAIGLDAEAVEARIHFAVEPLAEAIAELENRAADYASEYATKSEIECVQTECLSDLRAFVDHSRVDIMSDLNVEMSALRDELSVVRTSCASAIRCALILKPKDVLSESSAGKIELKNVPVAVQEAAGIEVFQTVMRAVKTVELRVDSLERTAASVPWPLWQERWYTQNQAYVLNMKNMDQMRTCMLEMKEEIKVLQSKQDVTWKTGSGARAQSQENSEQHELGPYGAAKVGHVSFATDVSEQKTEVMTTGSTSTSITEMVGAQPAAVNKSPAKPKPTLEEKLLMQKNMNIFAGKHTYSGEKDALTAYGFYTMIHREVGGDEMCEALKATELSRFMVGSALEWYQSVVLKMQKLTLRDGLKLFYKRFALNLTHSDKRLQMCVRKSEESVEQYQAKLLVLASELDFIDSMHLVSNPVGVTPQQLLAQFKSGCENAMWRRECRLCKTLDEAVTLVKEILAAEFSPTDVLGSNGRPIQINAIENNASSSAGPMVKRQQPCMNCGDWYCGEQCKNRRVLQQPKHCETCNTFGHSTEEHTQVEKQKRQKQSYLNESGASNL